MATAKDDRKLDAQSMNDEVLTALDVAGKTADGTSADVAKILAAVGALGGPVSAATAALRNVLKDLEDMPCYDGFDAEKLCALAGSIFNRSTATRDQLIALRRAVDAALTGEFTELGALKDVHVEIAKIHVVQVEALDVFGDAASLPSVPSAPAAGAKKK